MKYLDISRRFFLKLLLTFSYLLGNDIMLLNAAITYYALLSFVPMILILGLLLQKIFLYFPQTVTFFESMIASFDIELFEGVSFTKLLKNTKMAGFGIFGVISIFVTSTIFLRSLNRVFKKIFRIKAIKETLIHSLMPFLVYFIFIFVILVFIVSKVALVFLENFLVYYVDVDLSYPIYILEKFFAFPVVVFVVIITISYHFLSLRKIKWLDALRISLFFLVSIYLINIAFKHFYNISFYNAVYGALSSLIITLAYIYIFFLTFVFWAQYIFVERNYKGVLVKTVFDLAFENPNSWLLKILKRIESERLISSLGIDIGILKSGYEYVILLNGSVELVDENGLSIYLNRFDFFKVSDISDNIKILPSDDCLLLLITQGEKEFLESDSTAASAIFKSNEKVLIF